jgi:hypothetical protein
VEIRYYDAELIFGAMQTEGYARAVLANSRSQQAEERLPDRVARQNVLTRENPPDVRVVLGEAALHRAVGGEDTLTEQLRHLLRVAKIPNVSIRVLPFAAGAHRALGVGFTYEQGFEQLWKSALDERDSATMIRGRIGSD